MCHPEPGRRVTPSSIQKRQLRLRQHPLLLLERNIRKISVPPLPSSIFGSFSIAHGRKLSLEVGLSIGILLQKPSEAAAEGEELDLLEEGINRRTFAMPMNRLL